MSAEYYELGLEAYKDKDYARAIEILQTADPQQWDAQLYLGMSYYMAGRHEDARVQFGHLRDNCPVSALREQAKTAFLMVSSKIRQAAELKQAEDELTVEW